MGSSKARSSRRSGKRKDTTVRADAESAPKPPPVVAAEREEGEKSEGAATPTDRNGFGRVLLIVFIVSLIGGYLVGKARSPNYEKPAEAKGLIEVYVTKSSGVEFPTWQVSRTPDSRVAGIALQGGVIAFSCGFKSYHHDLTTGEELSDSAYTDRRKAFTPKAEAPLPVSPISKTPNKDSIERVYGAAGGDIFSETASDNFIAEMASHDHDIPAREAEVLGTPREGASINEVVGVMLGGAEVYTVKYAVSEVNITWKEMEGASRIKRFGRAVQLIGTGLSGFALGFYLGYEDAPDCEGREFSEQLKQKELWQAVGKNLIAANSLSFDRDPATSVISHIHTPNGNRLTLRDSWLAMNSVRLSNTNHMDDNAFTINDEMHDKLTSNTDLRDPLKILPFWAEIARALASWLSKSYQNSKLN